MKPIPEIEDAERRVVESTLKERYGKAVATQLADVELRLTPGDPQLSSCPTLYWEERGAAFVLTKVGESRWRTMFYYPAEPGGDQYGAGRPEFDDLFDCVTAVLRAQADHEKDRQGAWSGTTADDLNDAGEGETAP